MYFEEDKELEKCKSLALKYVSMQFKTEGQVADYLKRKSFSQEKIDGAMDFLREYKYVDDWEYCRAYFREGCRKGKGRRRIEQELANKKVSKNVIRESLDNYITEGNPDYVNILEEVGNEKDRATEIGRKMLKQQLSAGKEADKNFIAKVGRRLMTLGYDSQVLYSVIGTLMKEGKITEDEYE